MRRMKSKRQGLSGCSKKKRLFIVLMIFAGLVFLLDCQLRPIVKDAAAAQARILATRAINEAVNEVLTEENVQYHSLVNLIQDSEGNVQAAETNMNEMNRLKAAVSIAIQDQFDKTHTKDYSIPIGSLTGNTFFIGRGPGIPLTIQLMGSVTTELESEFASAGINQTCHRIMMNLHVQVYAIVPGCQSTTEIESNFCIAETVIVGHVPDAFLQMGGDSSALLSKMLQDSE